MVELAEPTALVGATEFVVPTELVEPAELVESTGLVEPAELVVSAVASDADESEDPPHPAMIPQTNTSAQQSVPRQDCRRTILRTSELDRKGRSSEVRQRSGCNDMPHPNGCVTSITTCHTPMGAPRQ